MLFHSRNSSAVLKRSLIVAGLLTATLTGAAYAQSNGGGNGGGAAGGGGGSGERSIADMYAVAKPILAPAPLKPRRGRTADRQNQPCDKFAAQRGRATCFD